MNIPILLLLCMFHQSVVPYWTCVKGPRRFSLLEHVINALGFGNTMHVLFCCQQMYACTSEAGCHIHIHNYAHSERMPLHVLSVGSNRVTTSMRYRSDLSRLFENTISKKNKTEGPRILFGDRYWEKRSMGHLLISYSLSHGFNLRVV